MKTPEPTKFEQLVEKSIAKISPKWALQRHRARMQFSFEAAQSTRLRSRSNVLAGPESVRNAVDRLELIKQVRDLECNFSLFRSIISKIALYSVGRLRYQAQTGNAEANKSYEAYLKSKFNNCDASARFNFRQQAAIALQSMLRDGDFFWLFEQSKDGLKIKGIESDRVGGSVAVTYDGNYIQGINVDPTSGKVQTYAVYDRTVNDAYTNKRDIPAQSVRQFYDPWRYDQYRGITPFAPVINTARDLKEVLEATLIGVKFENYHAGFITNDRGGLMDNDPNFFISSTQDGANGTPLTEEKMQFGALRYLPTGSKVDLVKSERPGSNWQSYTTMLVREIALALNLPFGFVYDLSGLGGPTARMDSQQAHRVIQGWQQILIDCGLENAKDRFLIEGFATGAIKRVEGWNIGTWQFPPAITIDVGRDSQAAISEVRAGMRTKADWYAEDGKDGEEQAAIIEQEAEATIQRAKGLAERTGVPVNIALDLLESRQPNPTGTFSVVDPNATDNNGALIQDIGIGGTQAMSDVISKVADGSISVDTARQLLISVFGMTEEQANKIFPPGMEHPKKADPTKQEPVEDEEDEDEEGPEEMARRYKEDVNIIRLSALSEAPDMGMRADLIQELDRITNETALINRDAENATKELSKITD